MAEQECPHGRDIPVETKTSEHRGSMEAGLPPENHTTNMVMALYPLPSFQTATGSGVRGDEGAYGLLRR